jgi:hypothetical protein
MSALKLKDKLDQVVYTSQVPIITDIKGVYSHSEGYLTGIIRIRGTKVKVTSIKGLWKITN